MQKCKKDENLRFLSFWVKNYRFFQKKSDKSGLCGGAEFGTHVSKKFELTIF
jgi:hypothetical protein